MALLYESTIPVVPGIELRVPSVREVYENQESFYGSVAIFLSTPYDLMLTLHQQGIDFSTITSWEMFCKLFGVLKNYDTSLLFKDLDLTEFIPVKVKDTGEHIFYNPRTDVRLDKLAYNKISKILCKLLFTEKVNKHAANEEAKKYLLDLAEKKAKRRARKKDGAERSQLEDIIISLVNTNEFPYNYETVKDISIFQLYASLHQVSSKIKFDNLMIGCYAGTVDTKTLDPKDLTWFYNI